MTKTEKLIASLPDIQTMQFINGQFQDVLKRPHAFVDSEGRLLISAEHGDDAADYYDRGYPWINPVLEAWAKDNGGYFEWEHPGAISFTE
tara:strand:- start:481 stop:750 length:270 start_codon:yes stop_codon:yes gene_type:complete